MDAPALRDVWWTREAERRYGHYASNHRGMQVDPRPQAEDDGGAETGRWPKVGTDGEVRHNDITMNR